MRAALILTVVMMAPLVDVGSISPQSARPEASIQNGQKRPSLLAQRSGLELSTVLLPQALSRLHETSGVNLLFTPSVLPADREVSCECRDLTVAQALSHLLAGTSIGFVEVGGHIVLEPTEERRGPVRNSSRWSDVPLQPMPLLASLRESRSRELRQQTGTVQGRIVDAQTEHGLAGAQVQAVGTGIGTLADAQGRYVLNGVPAGERVIEVQRIGYRPRSEPIELASGATFTLDFRLQEAPVAMDALVVTGTAAATRRVEIGNALSRLNANQIREHAPIANLSQMLQTRTSSVRIQGRSGMVGAGSDITVRGGSSLTLSNRPMIYVDGVRVDNVTSSGPAFTGAGTPSRIDDIPPEDIASIEIIKGPAAATLYGTEASNGVIQIITRRGVPGGAPTVTATVRQGAVWLHDPASVFEANHFVLPDGTVLEQNLIEEEEAAGRAIFRTGHLQTYSANMRGGADRLSYYLSGEMDDTEGYIPNNDVNRVSGRANLNLSVADNFDIEMSTAVMRSKIGLAPEGFSPNFGIIPMIVFGDPRTRDTPRRGFSAAPPEATRTVELISDVDRSMLSLRTDYRPTSWLSSRLILGTDVVNEVNTTLYPRQPEGADHFFGARGLGEITVETRRSRVSTLDLSASGRFELTPSLVSTTSVGFQYFGRRTDAMSAFGREFPAMGVSTVSAAAVTQATEAWVENRTVGGFVQQQFGLNDRLFLTAAVRGDDNSAFGEGYDAAYYPKVGASWLASGESFLENARFLNELRLRASWGQSGMQPDAFAAIRLYSPITGPGNVATITPGAVGNPDLGPERGEELEVGIDGSVFDQRIDFSLTYFGGRTKEAILARRVPPSTGFGGTQFVNIGELSRRGIEAEINVQAIERPGFSLAVGTALNTMSNRIDDMGGLPSIVFGYRETQAHVEGFPIGSFFSRRIVEAVRDPTTGRISSIRCDSGVGSDPQFRRPGGEPVPCANAPMIYFGAPGPGFEGSLFSTVGLPGNFTVRVNFAFATDYRMQNIDRSARTFVFQTSREWVELQQRDSINQAYVENNMRIFSMEDADFLRLREVSVTHRIGSRLLDRIGASSASINVAARNMATWTKYSGLDPETRSSSDPWGNQVQTLAPLPVQFVFTFSATR